MVQAFQVLAEPTRRLILDRLRSGESAVGDLADDLGLPQPTVSKHLRVLRDAGMVQVRVDAQRRYYRLRAEPLVGIAQWLEPYRSLLPDRWPDDGPGSGPVGGVGDGFGDGEAPGPARHDRSESRNNGDNRSTSDSVRPAAARNSASTASASSASPR
jgi:DNA-binding transcriptional ArsR family regulator